MGVTKKIGATTNSRKNYKKKKIIKAKPGGELICKNFRVIGATTNSRKKKNENKKIQKKGGELICKNFRVNGR